MRTLLVFIPEDGIRKAAISAALLSAIILLPSLACSFSDRVTTEVSSTTEPTIKPTDARVQAGNPPTAARPQAANTPTFASSAATKNPPAQVKLEVGSYSSYPSSIGGLYIAGEVFNKGNAPAWQTEVAISLLDGSGNVLAASSGNMADLDVVPPSGKYPFLILVDKPPTQWKEIKIQVQGEPFTGATIFPPYLDLKAEGVTGKKPQYGGYTLSGRVTNIGSKTAASVKIVATAYNQNGKVVDVGWTYSKLEQIQAGGNAPFELEFRNLKSAPTKYEVYVQGTEKK